MKAKPAPITVVVKVTRNPIIVVDCNATTAVVVPLINPINVDNAPPTATINEGSDINNLATP